MKMILLGIEIIGIIFYWLVLIGVIIERRKREEPKEKVNIILRIATILFALILSLIPLFNIILGIVWIYIETEDREGE